MGSGSYVVLEGIDGTGKSTLAQALVQYLENCGFRACAVAEPSRIGPGAVLREAWSSGKKLGWRQELELFKADRREIIPTVRQAMARGLVVVSDRSFLSSAVYQGIQADEEAAKKLKDNGLIDGGIHCSYMSQVIVEHVSWVPWPDAVLWLDATEAELLQRLSRRDDMNPREANRVQQQRYAEAYKSLAKELGFFRIEAMQDTQTTLQESLKALASKGICPASMFDQTLVEKVRNLFLETGEEAALCVYGVADRLGVSEEDAHKVIMSLVDIKEVERTEILSCARCDNTMWGWDGPFCDTCGAKWDTWLPLKEERWRAVGALALQVSEAQKKRLLNRVI